MLQEFKEGPYKKLVKEKKTSFKVEIHSSHENHTLCSICCSYVIKYCEGNVAVFVTFTVLKTLSNSGGYF